MGKVGKKIPGEKTITYMNLCYQPLSLAVSDHQPHKAKCLLFCSFSIYIIPLVSKYVVGFEVDFRKDPFDLSTYF